MKKVCLLSAILFAALSCLYAQPSVLGTYSATTISRAGGNATVAPSIAPINTTSVSVYTSASFKGLLHANPATGVVTITNAHPAGIYTVVVKAINGMIADSVSFTLTVGNTLCSQGGFVASTIAASTTRPQGITVADVNNDGKQDFLTSDFQTNTVTVKLGNGSGGFSTAGSVAVGTGPQTIITADFNNDGKTDVATANTAANTVSVRLGDGTGNFSGTTTVSVGTNPKDIAAGDFNGDGKKDIITANQTSGTVSIRLGDGAGGFTGSTDISTGANTTTVAVADFDNDGKQDFVAVTYTDGNVLVYRGDGTGNFTRSDLPYSIANGATDVATSDFNGDGFMDIAVVGETSKTITITTGDGTGKVRTGYAIAYTAPGIPHSVTVGDFNGDGKLDVAASNTINTVTSSISLLLNPGVVRFFYNTTVVAVPTTNYSLATGDFNADGRQDIVASGDINNNAVLLLGMANNIEVIGGSLVIASGSNNPFLYDYTDFGDVAGSRVTNYTIRNSSNIPLTVSNITSTSGDSANFKISRISFPTVVAAGASVSFSVVFSATDTGTHRTVVRVKSDNCDRPDYTFAIKANTVAPYVLVRYGDTVRQVATTNKVVHLPLPAFSATNASVTTSPGFTGILSLNPLTGLVTVSNAQPAGIYKIIARFYNGAQTATDSFTLIVQPSRCSSGNLYVKNTNLPNFIAPRAIATADFNNDNRPDLAVMDSGNSTVQVLLATDTGRFTYGGTAYVWNDPRKLAIADINNDGYPDIVTISYRSGIINFHRSNGLGGFPISSASAWRTSLKPTAIALADLNKDGWIDLVVGSDSSLTGSPVTSTLQVYFGTNSSFGFIVPSGGIEVAGDVAAIVIRDFTGDGYPDIATASRNRDVIAVRINNGTGGFGTGTEFRSSLVLSDMVAGDFNRDGRADVAVTGDYFKTFAVHLGTGTGTFTSGFSIYIYNAPVALALADLNGDGSQDWLAATPSVPNVFTILGDTTSNLLMPTNTFGPVVVDTGTMALTTGDWNADGLVDVATVSSVTNRVQIAYGRDNKINVQGNNITIPNSTAAPDSANLTHFTNTYTNDSATHQFVIRNTGAARLYVNSISLSGTNRTSFTLRGIQQQVAVEAGDSLPFTVTFLPKDGGVKEARVNISSISCNNASYSFLIRGKAVCTALSADNIWLGTTANWNTASNWSLGAVPNGCGKAVVNTGVPFMPQISTNASCYSLTLNNGATFTVISTGSLTITGP